MRAGHDECGMIWPARIGDGRDPVPAARVVSTAARASLAEVGDATVSTALMRADGSITAGTRALRRARPCLIASPRALLRWHADLTCCSASCRLPPGRRPG